MVPDVFRHRILLLGDAKSRPADLEDVLVRGGFQVAETPAATPPDFLLYTPGPGVTSVADEVRALATDPAYGGAPVFVLLGDGARLLLQEESPIL